MERICRLEKAEPPCLRGLLSSWLLVAGLEVVLFLLHPKLDALLDPETRSIVSRHEFKSLHLLYMNLSTTQWVVTILYICATVWAWRCLDRSAMAGAALQNPAACSGGHETQFEKKGI